MLTPQEKREVKHIASIVILQFFQSWGQTNQERLNTLQKLLDYVQLDVKAVRDTSNFIHLEGNDSERANQFYAELLECFPLGKYEAEQKAVEKLIMKYGKSK